MGLPSRLKQHYRYQFSVCINAIHKVSASLKDKLFVVWKTPTNKGKLSAQPLSTDDAVSQNIRSWWNQPMQFEESISMDVETQTFEPHPLVLLLKREKQDMTNTLGEFRINLADYANMIYGEDIISTDIPAQKFEFIKANVTIQFKLVEKSDIFDVEATEPLNTASSIQELKEELARVSHECAELKRVFIDSQTFSKSDYWTEKLPEMELNIRQYSTKVEDLNTYLHKMLQETKVTIMDDKISDLHNKMFADEEKLRRLSDIYNAFSQSTTQELNKIRERLDKITVSETEPGIMLPTFTRSLIKGSGNILPVSPRTTSRPASPLCIPRETPESQSMKYFDSPTSTAHFNSESNFEFKSKQFEEIRTRLERLEHDTKLLWPRLDLDEADLQQLHINAEELRWEREKNMENFYLFQKSQAQLAEELSKLKLQIDECKSLPQKLEQRVDFLEVQTGKFRKLIVGKSLRKGEDWYDVRSRSAPLLQPSPTLVKSPTPISPTIRSISTNQSTMWAPPPYHWFLLDHGFLFACDRDAQNGDLLVPAYLLIRFCLNNLDLARRREDWSVFDALFFALHFEVKKHSNSPSHLLFWLANCSFILEQLNSTVFQSLNLTAVDEYAQKIVKDIEGFIKAIYVSFASFVAKEFEGAINNFPLCNIGDYENEWVTTIIAKLEWVYALLRAYKFQDSFIQNVLGDLYATMNSTLFNLLCSESYLCTPARANQIKYFISTLDNWACSDHPAFSKIIDKLCHVREAANLMLAPKANLKEAAFRHNLFPNLTDLQVKHLLTIFLAETSGEKLPPTLLAQLTTQIAFSPSPSASMELERHSIFVSFELGAFFETEDLNIFESGPIPVRFSPPTVGECSSPAGFTNIVNCNMQDIEAMLTGQAFSHWRFLAQELEKWYKTPTNHTITQLKLV